METVIKFIKNASAGEIDVIMDEVFRRKQELYPEWDIQYLAVPLADKDETRFVLEHVIQMMRKQLNAVR